jgi:hypothetical protein
MWEMGMRQRHEDRIARDDAAYGDGRPISIMTRCPISHIAEGAT